MNFKALALGSVLALGSIFGNVAPAEAGTCWFQRGNTNRLAPTGCYTEIRTNANGHKVWDVIDHQGTKFTLVFWVDNHGDRSGEVEMIMNGRVHNGTWNYDNQGDRRINIYGGGEMAIRL